MNQNKKPQILTFPAFQFNLWQWEITRRVQREQQPGVETGITRPRYPLEKINSRAEIRQALKDYQELIVQKNWVKALLHYRLNIHEFLFSQQMEYREVMELLRPFFDPDITKLIRRLNESAQAFLCLTSARCLGALGYPHKAEGLILAHNRLRAKAGDVENHAWGLIELVKMRQFPGRQFTVASSNLNQVLKVARKQNFPSLLAAAYFSQAQLYILKHDLHSATSYLKFAEAIFRSNNDFSSLSQVFCGWSSYWLQRQQYFLALNSTSRAIRVATSQQNPRAILRAQICHGKACSATLIYSQLLNTSEKMELYRETSHAIGEALKIADQQGLSFELIEAASELLRLTWWEFKNAPQKKQELKPEFIPFTQMLIQHTEQIGWQLKLPELHALLVQFE